MMMKVAKVVAQAMCSVNNSRHPRLNILKCVSCVCVYATLFYLFYYDNVLLSVLRLQALDIEILVNHL